MDRVITEIDLSTITRVELITYKGREYVNNNVTHVELQLQDKERTLKIFVSELM